MNTYSFTPPPLSLDNSWDVIVVGGGPAGCTAAAAAAREGARTLLIEGTGALGGSGTSALVPAWCPFSDKEKIIYRGLAEQVFTAAKEGMLHVRETDLDWVPIDAERLKRVYDKLVTSYGATVRFQTLLSAVETEDGNIKALIISNKAGLSAVSAKVYVDCTGDADVSAWAGAKWVKGDDEGRMQPGTHCFVLTNVDEQFYRTASVYPKNPDSPIHGILASGKYPAIVDKHVCDNVVGPGAVGFNAGHVFDVDNTDPASTSEALMKGRRMAAQYRDALAEYHPKAFGNAFLVSTGSVMGIRETRRVIGDYVLNLDDWLNRRSFPDEICRNSYFIDMHMSIEEKKRLGHSISAKYEHYKAGESHGIPYRCLTPKGLGNLLVAGRCISVERNVQGSVRVMPVCLAMGEAAGMAAAHASEMAAPNVHAVDVGRLRSRLRKENVYLPETQEEELANSAVSLRAERGFESSGAKPLAFS